MVGEEGASQVPGCRGLWGIPCAFPPPMPPCTRELPLLFRTLLSAGRCADVTGSSSDCQVQFWLTTQTKDTLPHAVRCWSAAKQSSLASEFAPQDRRVWLWAGPTGRCLFVELVGSAACPRLQCSSARSERAPASVGAVPWRLLLQPWRFCQRRVAWRPPSPAAGPSPWVFAPLHGRSGEILCWWAGRQADHQFQPDDPPGRSEVYYALRPAVLALYKLALGLPRTRCLYLPVRPSACKHTRTAIRMFPGGRIRHTPSMTWSLSSLGQIGLGFRDERCSAWVVQSGQPLVM